MEVVGEQVMMIAMSEQVMMMGGGSVRGTISKL